MNDVIFTVENLSMHFGGIIALKEVSFSVKKGTITALIGPNGAGKTTLFNCLTGFYHPTLGKLIFFRKGKKIELNTSFSGSHQICQNGIARTFQNIRLFQEMTVVENLLVAQHLFVNKNIWSGLFQTPAFRLSEKKALDTAFYWLEKFELTDYANHLAGRLPYGKQRHLEIARAMCTQPTLLCLDEPAAGLNPHESHTLCDIILSLRQEQGVTVILIEHDMSVVMNISDEIIVLDHGEVICKGEAQVVRNDKKVIAAYLGIAQS